jgi:pantothenate kinase-related protein Tda10
VGFEKSDRKEDASCLVSRIKRGDDMTRPKDEVKGSIDIAVFTGWIVGFYKLLDIEIHYA